MYGGSGWAANRTKNISIMKQTIKYDVISFCSVVGNFCYAYPSDDNTGLTLKQLKDSDYQVNFYANLDEASEAMNKLQTVITNA